MKNIKKFSNLVPYIFTLVIGLSCQQNDYAPTRLSKRDLNMVNQAIFEIVVPKKEDKRVQFERELPWHQLPFKERTDKYHSIGTAFFISNKRLASAAHVFGLEDYSTWHEFYVRNVDGEVFPVDKIHKYSQYRDYVEFELKKYPKKIRPLKVNKKVEIGDTVFAIGNAQGEGISVRGGQVASFTPEHVNGKWDYIRFSSPASPGNSGGPLVNAHAEVVGVIVMKNQSENYNYALPITEVENISSEKATFFEHNVTVFDGTQTEVADWEIEHPLPSDCVSLEKLAQKNKNQFYGQLLDKLKKTKGDKLFPEHEMFREYLRDQSLGKYFGAIQNNTSLNEWSVEHVNSRKIKVGPRQFIHLAKGKLGHYEVLIEKPEGMKLMDFVENSQLQFELLTNGMGFTRSIGKERIRILSFGTPDHKQSWQDDLGRKWISSYWFITYSDVMYSLDCLPAPKGVLCFFDGQDASQYSTGYDHFKRYNVLEQPVSYFGTIAQWEEFIALGQKYLPDNFDLHSLKFNKGQLEVHFNGLQLKTTDLKLTKESIFSIFGGYDVNETMRASVEAVSVQLEENEYEGITIKRNYSPSDTSSKEHIKKWKKITRSKAPYDGRVYPSDDIYYSKHAVFKKENSAYLISCFAEEESKRKGLLKRCNKQKKLIVEVEK